MRLPSSKQAQRLNGPDHTKMAKDRCTERSYGNPYHLIVKVGEPRRLRISCNPMAFSPSLIWNIVAAVMLSCGLTACSNVQVLRLTNQSFAPRPMNDVEVLDKEPAREHLRLAQLVESSSTSSLDHLQRDILMKAAKLGAAQWFSRGPPSGLNSA
jgi:hypothetical protein